MDSNKTAYPVEIVHYKNEPDTREQPHIEITIQLLLSLAELLYSYAELQPVGCHQKMYPL